MLERILAGAALGLLLAAGARAGDCYNDDVPLSNDLEPPAPGSASPLLSVSDEDVSRLLERIAAAERRRAGQRPQQPGPEAK